MERVTVANIHRRALVVTELAWELGIIGADDYLEIQQGSKTYGRAWRIWGEGGRDIFNLGRGFLGMTRGDAYAALGVILSTLRAVKDTRQGVS
jgi:hypothetical protein